MGQPAPAEAVDRAAAVRAALRRLVARNGFHGASMSAVARAAGVATGTAYVHYASKEDLVFAAYFELKRELGVAATRELDRSAPVEEWFVTLWLGMYRFLREEPDRARFLLQMEVSPYAERAHEAYMASEDDLLLAVANDPAMAASVVDLPPMVLYDLSLGSAVRLAAAEESLDDASLELVARQSWRAVSVV